MRWSIMVAISTLPRCDSTGSMLVMLQVSVTGYDLRG
jgi:hypothetical protein